MAYERNTTEGIRTWLTAETSTPGWNSLSIAKGLTEDVMTLIVDHYEYFDAKIRQGILLSTMYMRKGDLMLLQDELNKVINMALNDSDEFVKTTANVLKDYPSDQQLDLNIDLWSQNFRSLLTNIGSSIKQDGFNFHPLEDMILQSSARTTPPHVSTTYNQYKSTHIQHFHLNTNNIISSQARYKLFDDLVKNEELSEVAEQKASDAAAQKRAAGHDLQSGRTKRINSTTTSPTTTMTNPFPFPSPAAAAAAAAVPMARPGMPIVRQNSVGSVPGASSLFTKRPARPTSAATSGGGLFINSKKPMQRSGGGIPVRPMNGLGGGGGGPTAGQRPPPTHVPRGFQKVQKTQMLDFNAATEIEQNVANEVKRVQDDEKARKEAIRQEAVEKKARLAAEKRAREEEKKAQKLALQEAKAQRLREKAEQEAHERALAEQEARDRAEQEGRDQAEAEQRDRLDQVAAAAQAESSSEERQRQKEEDLRYEMQQQQQVVGSSSSIRQPPPTSMSIKSEHVFAVPAIPVHHLQVQQQRLANVQLQGDTSSSLHTQYSQPHYTSQQVQYSQEPQAQHGQQPQIQYSQQPQVQHGQQPQAQYSQQRQVQYSQQPQAQFGQQPQYNPPQQYSQQPYNLPPTPPQPYQQNGAAGYAGTGQYGQPQYSQPQYNQQPQYAQQQQAYGQQFEQPYGGGQQYHQHQQQETQFGTSSGQPLFGDQSQQNGLQQQYQNGQQGGKRSKEKKTTF